MNHLNKFNHSLKLDRKIYMVFAIVVLIAVSNAVISAWTIRNSKKIVYTISLVTNPTLEKLEEMNLLVTRSRMLVTNWVYLPSNATDKDSLKTLNHQIYPQLKSSLSNLMAQQQSVQNSDHMKRVFRDYEELMLYENKITETLIRFDDYQDPMKKFAAEELIENEIIPRSNAIMLQLKELTGACKVEAAAMQDRMISSYYYLLVMVLGLAVLIIASVLMAGAYMLKKVIVPIMKIREIVLQLSRGELPDFNLRFSYNALGEMSYAIRQLIDGLKRTAHFTGEIGKGNLNTAFQPLSEKDVFGSALLEMRTRLARAAESDAARNWANQGMATLGSILHQNTENMHLLCGEVIAGLVQYVEAQQGAIYLVNRENENDPFIELGGFYGLNRNTRQQQRIELKEGLLGQAIADNRQIAITGLSNPEYTIETGLTRCRSCHVFIVPLYARGEVLGAIEIVSASEISPVKTAFLSHFAEAIAANMFSLRAHLFTRKLLADSRKQAEELAAQEEELRQINDELLTQSQLLKLSEEELKSQQEELKTVNTELETKAILLEEKNLTIEDARQSIAFKAEQLEKSNKYKSAFLANMSHELRTPLNSVLILAKLLADNREKNLNDKQTEYARVIHKSGSDLLLLINDILDLSKIESGKIELTPEQLKPSAIISDLHQLFRELANEKGIHFQATMAPNVPDQLFTDRMRLDQILKNLLSNAFKFTPKDGTVTLSLEMAPSDVIFNNQQLFAARDIISISVRDTGIGIPDDKQQLVFEAFKQADGSTSRKYGGTGLGLAISRELAHLLGGDIVLMSREGKGSTFTLYLPILHPASSVVTESGRPGEVSTVEEYSPANRRKNPESPAFEIFDDRHQLGADDLRILIVEDDLVFSKTLMELAHSYGMKAIATVQGDMALSLASRFLPDAILLDMQLPVMDGWTVLKKLKENKTLCHIPVYVISGMDRQKLGMDIGAAGYLLKPVRLDDVEKILATVGSTGPGTGREKILLVENGKPELERIIHFLREREKMANLKTVENLEECIHNMQLEKFDRILVNASLAKTPESASLVSTIESESKKRGTTFLLYDEKDLSDEFMLNGFLKGEVPLTHEKSMETVSGEANFNRPARTVPDFPDLLTGKKVLLVDDDMRNIYAITSILETEGMDVICAYDGRDALEKLNETTGIELVLMDIMMPEMDGYAATREIRKNPLWEKLPVIALTAKAMNGDREKCLLAGASDYLSKPLNTEQLLSVMKIWLYHD